MGDAAGPLLLEGTGSHTAPTLAVSAIQGGANLYVRMAHGARMKLLDSCETARVLTKLVRGNSDM